jgi:glyceraldehyde 3-phosphate dehydrogenase
MVYLVANTKKPTTKDELNGMLKRAAEGPLKGILQYTDEELVSSDFKLNAHSSIVDGKLTSAQGNLIQLGLWYDNEWGYSCRLADVTQMVLAKLPSGVA